MRQAAAPGKAEAGLRDLRGELEPLRLALARLPGTGGRAGGTGCAVQFLSAQPGAGTSSIAASFALMAAARARRYAWLVGLDLTASPHLAAFRAGFAGDCGPPGQAYDASLGGLPAYDLAGSERGDAGHGRKLLAVHQIEGTRLMVTQLRTERLKPGEAARFASRPGWWTAVRRAADWVIADAPALSVSDAGLEVAPEMDGTVLVVAAEAARPRHVLALRDLVEARGGLVLGIVVNRLAGDAMFFDRMMGG